MNSFVLCVSYAVQMLYSFMWLIDWMYNAAYVITISFSQMVDCKCLWRRYQLPPPSPTGTSGYLCCGSSNLHRVLASSQIVETYSSYFVVCPAVDLDDLLGGGVVTVDLLGGDVVTVTAGGGGRVTGGSGTLAWGCGSGLSMGTWVSPSCWSLGGSVTSTGTVGCTAGWMGSAGRYTTLSGCLWVVSSVSGVYCNRNNVKC